MKKNIQIIENIDDNTDIFTKKQLLNFCKKNGIISLSNQYNINNDILLEIYDKCDINLLKQTFIHGTIDVNCEFIDMLIGNNYLNKGFIKKLSLKFHSNISDSFFIKYNDYIDHEKILICRLLNNDIKDHNIIEEYLEKNNMWSIASVMTLSKAFIKRNAHNLDWKLLPFFNEFNDDEKQIFKEYIQNIDYDMDHIHVGLNQSMDISLIEQFLDVDKNGECCIKNS